MSTDAWEGSSCLYVHFLNQDYDHEGTQIRAFGFVKIPASYHNNGLEPENLSEFESGKDLRSFDAIELYAKGTIGANASVLNISIQSPNGHSSRSVPLKDWIEVSD